MSTRKIGHAFCPSLYYYQYAYWFGLQLLVIKQDQIYHPLIKNYYRVIVFFYSSSLYSAPSWPDIKQHRQPQHGQISMEALFPPTFSTGQKDGSVL